MSYENINLKIILVDAYEGNIPSLGLAYLAAYVREKRGLKNIKILQKKFCPNLVEAILSEKADLVGYFSVTPGFDNLLKIIKEVRQNSSVLQIMGGPHLTALPESLPKEIDLAVAGEGEEVLAEIIDLLQKEHGLPKEELYKIKSLVFRDKGEIVKTSRGEGIKNLDEIPLPARDLLNITGYFPNLIRAFPTKTFRSSGMMTSRGCPYHCIFCQENVLSRFRSHTAERTVAEIQELVEKYQVNFIQIMDDQFLVNRERLKQIVDLVRIKGLHKKTAFYCYLRANQITEETAKLLRLMNVKLVFIGFESGSDRILKFLKDPSCSVEKNQQAYGLCRQNNIEVYGSFIIGSPQETMADVKMTYDFIRKNRMATAEVFILTPLPGTKIWDYAQEKGYLNLSNMNWNNFLIKMSERSDKKIWLAENINQDEYFKFYQQKIRPVLWHYLQTANSFSLKDLFNFHLWQKFFKKPKFYLSVFKQSIISLFNPNKYAKN